MRLKQVVKNVALAFVPGAPAVKMSRGVDAFFTGEIEREADKKRKLTRMDHIMGKAFPPVMGIVAEGASLGVISRVIDDLSRGNYNYAVANSLVGLGLRYLENHLGDYIEESADVIKRYNTLRERVNAGGTQ